MYHFFRTEMVMPCSSIFHHRFTLEICGAP